jgi:hypothetical protein
VLLLEPNQRVAIQDSNQVMAAIVAAVASHYKTGALLGARAMWEIICCQPKAWNGKRKFSEGEALDQDGL